MKKLRFVSKIDNPNIGFTESELLILNEKKHIHPQNVLNEFLKKAGKKSNVFDTNFKDINEYLVTNFNFFGNKKEILENTLYLVTI